MKTITPLRKILEYYDKKGMIFWKTKREIIKFAVCWAYNAPTQINEISENTNIKYSII